MLTWLVSVEYGCSCVGEVVAGEGEGDGLVLAICMSIKIKRLPLG